MKKQMTPTEATGHPYKELMLKYDKDWAETQQPWKRWQYKGHNKGSLWQSLYGHPNWLENFQYRRIPTPPATIPINDAIRRPLGVVPASAEEFYRP